MEVAALTKARDHAKAAHTASQNADTTVAINEYSLAAGEFARAATGTSSIEAHRILKLLEDENRQLSSYLENLVKKPLANTTLASIDEKAEATESPLPSPSHISQSTKNDAILKAHPSRIKQSSSVFVPPRPPKRELSSSIASGLASARGIRSSHDKRPLAPSVTIRQAPGDLQTSSRRTSTTSKGAGIPPPITGKREAYPSPSLKSKAQVLLNDNNTRSNIAASAAPTKEDEGFATWSATFGTILSRLSAPLAFAGLPLSVEEARSPPESSMPSSKPARSSTSASIHGQDVTNLFSKGALTSVQYPTSKIQESFYHVPVTGHSASYANILLYDEKERRRSLAASMHSQGFQEDDEDFNEAYERIPNPATEPTKGKTSSSQTVEALEIENRCLKESLDAASKRLATFENASQSSHLAMQESIRFQRPISPQRSRFLFGGKTSEETAEKRLRALSEKYGGLESEVERLKRENDKLGGYIQRYRDKFESMKQTARKREVAADGQKTGTDRGRFMAG